MSTLRVGIPLTLWADAQYECAWMYMGAIEWDLGHKYRKTPLFNINKIPRM